MYDELVNALRGFEDYDGLDFFENRTYAQDIAREAADAIEKLSAFADIMRHLKADGWYLQKTKNELGGVSIQQMPLPEPPKEET